MNKNLIIILYFSLAAIGLVLATLVTIFAPEQLEVTVQNFLQVLGLASTAAVTIYLLGNQSKDIAEVKAQTNGNLSKAQEQIADLQHKLLSVVSNAPPADQGK